MCEVIEVKELRELLRLQCFFKLYVDCEPGAAAAEFERRHSIAPRAVYVCRPDAKKTYCYIPIA